MRHTIVVLAGCVGLWSGLARAQFLDVAADVAAAPIQGQLLDLADVTATASGAAVSGPESPLSKDYLDLFLADTRETATAPLHWDRDDWRTAGLVGGGLVITGLLLDKPVRKAAQRGRNVGGGTDNFFHDVQHFGTARYQAPVLLGFYAYGSLADDFEAQATALDGVSATIITDLVTIGIKQVSGRARPFKEQGRGHFRPFQGGDTSFPSGHTSGAFALASVIATHYDSPWVDVTAYGIASMVGAARIRLDKHWLSDVAGGALIGGLIGHHLVEFNRRWRSQHEAWKPTLETDGQQLVLAWRY